MNDNDRIRQRIHDYVVANFLFGTMDIEDDANLLDGGVVDSTGVLELVLFAEEELGVAISDEEVLPERFESVSSLAAFVSTKLASAAPVAVSERGVR